MKNWLVALLGVSLVAISYTAYELELKKPASAPPAQTVAASGTATQQQTQGQPQTTPAPQSPAPVAAVPTPASQPEASPEIQAQTPIAAPSQDVGSMAAEPKTDTAAPDKGYVAKVDGAEATAKAPEPGPAAEVPSMAEKALDTVASLLTGKGKTDEAATPGAGEAGPVEAAEGSEREASETEGQAQNPAASPPAASGPLAKAVDTVRDLLTGAGEGGEDNEVAAAPSGASEPAATETAPATGAEVEPGTPKGLVERAVEAVTELVAPLAATDTSPAAPGKAAEETAAAPQAPGAGRKNKAPAGEPDKETVIAARAPEATPPPPAAKAPADEVAAPSFDVVRVERDGSAVIAGRAEPGATVELRAGGQTLGSATASRRGEFVIIPDQPIPAGSSALALEAQSADGRSTTSNQVVTVVVPGPKAERKVESQVAEAPVPAPPAPIPAMPAPAAAPATAAAPTPAPAPAPAPAIVPEQKVAVAPSPAPETAVVEKKPQTEAPEPVAPAAPVVPVTPAPVVAAPAVTVPAEASPPAPAQPATTKPAEKKTPAAAKTKVAAAPAATDKPPLPASPKLAVPKGDGIAETQGAVVAPLARPSGQPRAKAAAAAPETGVSATEKMQETTAVAAAEPEKTVAPAVMPDQAATAAVQTPAPAEIEIAAAPQAPSNATKNVSETTASAPAGTTAPASAPDAAEPRVAVVLPEAKADIQNAPPPTAAGPAPVPATPAPTATAPAPVPAAPVPTAAAPAPATTAPAPTATAPASITPAPVAEAPAPAAEAPAKMTEPLVVVSEPGSPSRVLQGGSPKPDMPVTFDTVDYDDDGQIILAGRVAPGADVRAYLGASLLGDAKAGPEGQWVLRTTRQIDPGKYELRVDKIDTGGKVLARVTAPFERAAPEAVARVRANGEVIIQPGDNLWNISRALYGTGTQYTVIYDANRNQISEPDLIFPGQVFMTPGAVPPPVSNATSG